MNKQDWTYKKLGEVCDILGRIGFRGYTREDYVNTIEEGAISLSPSNIINNRLDFSNCTYITWDKYNQSPEIMISKGDVIFVKTASVGKCAFVSELPHESTINPQFVVFKNIKISNRFLFHELLSPSFQYKVQRIKSGTSVPTITQKGLSELEISYPPIGEQERIVAELDLLQGIIEKKKEQLKAYDQLAQSIFYTMFGDPIDNPKGWEVKKLGRVCTFTQGIQVPVEEQHKVKREGDIQFLRIIDFTQGKEEPRYVTNKNDKYVLHEREIAIVRYGTPGFICYGKNGAIANNLFKIKPNQNDMFDFYFMLYWLRSDAFQASVKNKQYGAALQAIKFNTIQGIGIILPPLSLQEEFAEKVEAIERQKALVQQSIDETQTMFDYTMDKYFG